MKFGCVVPAESAEGALALAESGSETKTVASEGPAVFRPIWLRVAHQRGGKPNLQRGKTMEKQTRRNGAGPAGGSIPPCSLDVCLGRLIVPFVHPQARPISRAKPHNKLIELQIERN